jgi:hypothetical protein
MLTSTVLKEGFRGVPPTLQADCGIGLGTVDCLLPDPFQFVTHSSSHYRTIYSEKTALSGVCIPGTSATRHRDSLVLLRAVRNGSA